VLDAASGARREEDLSSGEDMYRPTPILARSGERSSLETSRESGHRLQRLPTISSRCLTGMTVKAQSTGEGHCRDSNSRQQRFDSADAYPRVKIEAVVDKIAYDATTVNNVTTMSSTCCREKKPKFMQVGLTAT